MDILADTFTSTIIDASNASIPRSRPTAKSKPWWNENLRLLRKDMAYLSRNSTNSTEYREAKTRYFNAIKRAKIEHWNAFLKKEDPQLIFKAMSYTKDIIAQPIPGITDTITNTIKSDFNSQCNAFRTALFPEPPLAPEVDLSEHTVSDWEWPKLSSIELQNACIAKIKGKTPGPDNITQDIIT